MIRDGIIEPGMGKELLRIHGRAREQRVRGQFKEHAQQAAEGLRAWRRAAGMTQVELAAACGVSRGTVLRWEDPSTDAGPTPAHLIRLCEATGAIPEVLYRRITQKESSFGAWA